MIVVAFSLMLVAPACAAGATSADRIVIRRQLPTLTYTPVPTPIPISTLTLAPNTVAVEAAKVASPPAVQSNNDLAGVAGSNDISTASMPSNRSVSEEASESTQANGVQGVSTTSPSTRVDIPTDALSDSAIGTPTAIATEMPVPTNTPTATEIPLTSTVTATPIQTPLPESWIVGEVNVYSDLYQDGLLLYGNLLNNTGSDQEILDISGTFYDTQGQVIASEDATSAYWSAFVIPQGRTMPFELTVDGIQGFTDFDLDVEAESISENMVQDFEFLDLSQWNEDDLYCLIGKVRNPSGEVEDYLIIIAILYDDQDRVVNFGDYQGFGGSELGGGETLDFDVCIPPPNQGMAHYELLAWGQ